MLNNQSKNPFFKGDSTESSKNPFDEEDEDEEEERFGKKKDAKSSRSRGKKEVKKLETEEEEEEEELPEWLAELGDDLEVKHLFFFNDYPKIQSHVLLSPTNVQATFFPPFPHIPKSIRLPHIFVYHSGLSLSPPLKNTDDWPCFLARGYNTLYALKKGGGWSSISRPTLVLLFQTTNFLPVIYFTVADGFVKKWNWPHFEPLHFLSTPQKCHTFTSPFPLDKRGKIPIE